MNGDGKMDINEFSVACKLINLKMKGMELPKSLPPQLLNSGQQAAAMGMGGMMAPNSLPLQGGMPGMPGNGGWIELSNLLQHLHHNLTSSPHFLCTIQKRGCII